MYVGKCFKFILYCEVERRNGSKKENRSIVDSIHYEGLACP